MKLSQFTPIFMLLIGAASFKYLFWMERFGVNLLLFDLLLLGMSFILSRTHLTSRSIQAATAGILICSLSVLYHGSGMAIVMHHLSWLLFVGLMNQGKVKSIIVSIPIGFSQFGYWISSLIGIFTRFKRTRGIAIILKKWLKLLIIPSIILLFFYIIFYNANSVFANYSERVFAQIGEWLSKLLIRFSIPKIIFLLLGFCVTAWTILRSDIPYFEGFKSRLQDVLVRTRRKKGNLFLVAIDKTSHVGLKNEYRMAVILMLSLNLLLLIVNGIDIRWVWFGFQYDGLMNLSQFVHEGTFLLILGILVSMLILFYYFRENLNFYPKKKLLILLATAWIAQNTILVISVAVRNIHYIHYYGLAYKRIGVFIFLLATLSGLILLAFKIHRQKTIHFVVFRNMWFTYLLLVGFAVFNWDGIIAKHNLQHTKQRNMDQEFLLSLSDKVLPQLYERKDLFKSQPFHRTSMEKELNRRIENFVARYEKQSWRSYNYADARAYAELKRRQ